MILRRSILWAIAAIGVTAGSVFAFVALEGPLWPDGPVTLHLQLGTSPTYSDGTNPNTTAIAALQHWNSYMSRVQLTGVAGSNATKAAGNGVNNVFSSPNIYGQSFPPGVLAVAMWFDGNTHRVESDVIVNTAWTWDSYRGSLKANQVIDLRRVLMHEFGHVLGLDHPDESGQYVDALMNSNISNIDRTTPDDQKGVASLYGRGTANPHEPPTIPPFQPDDQTVVLGSAVAFHVEATGTPPLAYQWFKDGSLISGADEATFEITVTQAGDAGEYYVRVSNAGGTEFSRHALLNLTPQVPPSFSRDPDSLTVTEGSEARFNAYAFGQPAPEVQWLKDGVAIPGAIANIYSIAPVQMSDAGKYRLRATNPAGEALSREATLVVIPGQPPTITFQPVPVAATAGGVARIEVGATSNVTLSYQWLKDGTPIPGATESVYFISPVSETSEGLYSVVVSTAHGSATSRSVTLTVYASSIPPVATIAGAEEIRAGAILRLGFTPITHAFTYQWYRNGQPLNQERSNLLTRNPASIGDTGEYHVVLTNQYGSTASLKKYVTVAPATPPTPAWLSSRQHGDIVYFLFANPARIERFDLTTETFLAPVALPRTPSAMTVHEGKLVVGFGSQVSTFPLAGGAETALATAPGPIVALAGHENHVYGLCNTSDSTDHLFGVELTTAQIKSIPAIVPWSGALAVDQVRRRLLIDRGLVMGIDIKPDGTFGPDFQYYSAYGRDTYLSDRLYLAPDGSRLLNRSGTVMAPGDLSILDNVGSHLDDAAFLPNGGFLVLRRNRLISYSPAFSQNGDFNLTAPGEALALREGVAHVFFPPTGGAATIGRQRIPLTDLVPPQVAIAVDPTTLAYEPGGVWQAPDGTVLLFSREHSQVFRWSVTDQRYVDSIPLRGSPGRATYAREQNKLYLQFDDGEARSLSLEDGSERHLRTSSTDLQAIGAAGDLVLLVNHPNFNFLDQDGRQRSQGLAVISPTYVWNSAQRRLYYFLDWNPIINLNALPVAPDGTMGPLTTLQVANFGNGESMRPPILVSPSGTVILLGTGKFYDAVTLQEKNYSIATSFEDAVWQNNTLFTARNRAGGIEVQCWGEATTYVFRSAQRLPGRVLRLFAINSAQLLLVSSVHGRVQFTVLDRDLNVQNHVNGSGTQHGRLINLSTRADVGTGDRVMIAGFVVIGSAPKRILVRGIGPTLGALNVEGSLPDPVLEVFDHAATSIAHNDDWEAGNPADIAATFASVGAFALPAGSTDAATVLTLPPGLYTAILSGKAGNAGIGLVEVYDLEATAPAHRLVNMSTRAMVGTGARLMIPGLVIDGAVPKRVLVRAVGPSLTAVGLPANIVLADPQLEIVNREGQVVADNDNWEDGNPAAVAAAGTSTSAFPLESGSADAAQVVTLVPGSYTVLVRGTNGTSGVALVEAYEIP